MYSSYLYVSYIYSNIEFNLKCNIMDVDFHYYGTGTAAKAAGFSLEDSALLANVAQYVDWFNSDFWSWWYLVNHRGKPIKDSHNDQYRYNFPQLTSQLINWEMVFDYDHNIWCAFHFPPGNLPYIVDGNNWEKTFCDNHVVRNTKLGKNYANKLCRPYSKFILDMTKDTLKKFNDLSNASGDDLKLLVASYVFPRKRCPVEEGRKIAMFLLGVRLHIFADSWAHQDFTGEANKAINSVGTLNNVYAKDKRGNYKLCKWTGTLWALHNDTDCAAAPLPVTDKTSAGHGQLGHHPDYSWDQIKYPAAWLPNDKPYHERNNPLEYDQAWMWMRFFLELCNQSKSTSDHPDPTPDEINQVISTWHELSSTKLKAVEESENLWKKTTLAKGIPTRWNIKDLKSLGVYDGLPLTRYGHVNIVQNSILHYMETAAAIHYQFCVEWLKANTEYTWKYWTPVT